MEGLELDDFENLGKKERWSGLQHWMKGKLAKGPLVSD